MDYGQIFLATLRDNNFESWKSTTWNDKKRSTEIIASYDYAGTFINDFNFVMMIEKFKHNHLKIT